MVLKDILAGKYHIILASPEMLQSPKFINSVLRKPGFAHKIISLFVDEAHCISHWGADFRKAYGTLGSIRTFLPESTPVMAVSATLTARVRRDIQNKLEFPKTGSNYINLGNDRRNVSIVVRAMQHHMNTYIDIECALPETITRAEDIPMTWIYADSIEVGSQIVQHLRNVLQTRNKDVDVGVIRPFNARLSAKYRQKAMQECREGNIRILVCTEAAGMGCDIRNIEVVIQWKLPRTLSNFVQRAGRAGRDGKQPTIAILLVERSAYVTVLTEESASLSSDGKGKGKMAPKKGKQSADEKRRLKEYAHSHGVDRGGRDGDDSIPSGDQPFLDLLADDEGLLAFVQSTTCRRKIWAKVFDSTFTIAPSVPCCDICDPSLLSRARPGVPPLKATATKPMARGEINNQMRATLETWRETVLGRDYAHSFTTVPSDILKDDQIILLSSVGNITDKNLEELMKPSWLLWKKYGKELESVMKTTDAPFRSLPRKPRNTKRPVADSSLESNGNVPKRPRVSSQPQASGSHLVHSAATATRSQTVRFCTDPRGGGISGSARVPQTPAIPVPQHFSMVSGYPTQAVGSVPQTPNVQQVFQPQPTHIAYPYPHAHPPPSMSFMPLPYQYGAFTVQPQIGGAPISHTGYMWPPGYFDHYASQHTAAPHVAANSARAPTGSSSLSRPPASSRPPADASDSLG